MTALIALLALLNPVHHGHTWWTGTNSTVSFNAQSGETINVFLGNRVDAAQACHDMGGRFVPTVNLCKGVDF